MDTKDMGDLDPATGHDPQEAVIENEVAVTCEEDGSYDEVVYCGNENCPAENHELSRETKTVPSTGAEHDWGEPYELKAATCTTSGVGKYTCGFCGKVEYKSIPASHDWQNVGEDTATCTEGGTQHQICDVCHEEQDIDTEALGHLWNEGEVVVEPTCAKEGKKLYTCQREGCDETKTETIAATGNHSWTPDYVVDATCTEDEKVGTFCSVCKQQKPGTEVTVMEGTALGHDPIELVDDEEYVAPTCTEGGVIVTGCSRCDLREVEEVEALGHVEGEHAYLPADCENNGRDVIYCDVCGEIMDTVDLGELAPKLGHDLSTEVVAPTCSTEGYTITTCSRCDYELIEDETPIDPENHFHGVESTVLKSPNCEKGTAGVVKYTCVNCNTTWYGSYPAYHNPGEWVEDPKATCTEDGLKTATCQTCGKTLEEVVPAHGHNYVEVIGEDGKTFLVCEWCFDEIHCQHENTEVIPPQAATCVAEGWTEGLECLDCGEVIEVPQSIEIDENNHAAVTAIGEEKEATCTEDGITAGKKCTACETVIEAQTVIPATGHTWGEWYLTREATCTVDGEKAHECEACDAIETESTGINPNAHTAGEAVEENVEPATCTEGGSYDSVIYCTVCEAEISRETVTTEALGHTEETMAAVEATCTETGLTEGKKCSVCGTVLTAQETIPATGHAWREWQTIKKVTCTADGVEARVCAVCGEMENRSIPATGHTAVTAAGKAATCTETGLTDGEMCGVCGEILKAQEEIPALGHKEEVVAGKAATCTEAGLTDGVKCSECGETLKAQEEIPAKGHTEETVPGKAATCTEAGLTDGEVCSVCGATLTEQTTIPATGHSWSDWTETKAATCTEDGAQARSCSACGAEETQTIAAKGHSYTVSWSFNEDFTKKIKTTTCTVCGETTTEEFEL